ncbi:spore coat associated protein CotJA [Clostridium sp. cel8]|nr:spore coat associated protein CotJA [Clostridium sp. cel8]
MMPNMMPSPNMFPKLQLARAYIVPQPYVGLLPLDEALREGSIFPNLVMPYKRKKR